MNPESESPWKAPHGYEQVLEKYGDIYDYINEKGELKTTWFRERATYLTCPWDLRLAWAKQVKVKRFSYHVECETFPMVIQAIHREELGEHLKFYGGGFNFRSQRGSSTSISLHAFIAAWDFNPETNKLGNKGRMHPRVVEIFEDFGFTWGGRFKNRPDPMHFQGASGY
jgi:hypothetical protein